MELSNIANVANANKIANIASDVEAVISLFVASQDRGAKTRELYGRTVAAFFSWLASTGRTAAALTAADIIAYKEALLREGKSSLTVASYLNSVRRFFAWTEANKIYPNVAADVHAPARKQEFRKQPLTVKKAAELLRYASTLSRRDYAIINLMARTGLRCIEVARANVGDIVYKVVGDDNKRVLLVQGKGRTDKDNFVILDEAAYTPIAAYLQTRKAPASAPLFEIEGNHHATESHHEHDTDFNARRLSTRSISAIVKAALRAVGLDGREFTAHSLRHTVGTNILRAGGTLEQAQMTLRHSNPATTEIYARMALQERRFTNGGEALISDLYARALA